MPWYYNTSSGELTHQTGTLANIVGFLNTHTPGLGWHELRVPDSATEAQAAADAKKEFPKATAPTTNTGKALQNQAGSQLGSLGNAAGSILGLPTLKNTRDFVSRMFRVVIGAALIIIGVAQLSGAGNALKGLKVIPV